MKAYPLNRRAFLLKSAVATTMVCTWEPMQSLCHGAAPTLRPQRLSLNGAWQVSELDKKDCVSATVPGCIHTDLLAAGKISDPFYRDNEQAVQWVGQKSWVYRRNFQVPKDILDLDRLFLRCEGLDTLATIRINGAEIGRTNNMFQTWEFDVKPQLKVGENSIEVLFASPFPYMEERNSKRPLYEWIGSHEPKGRAWVRKEPCNFGWDWGPVLVTCGIWRNIGLLAFNEGRLADVLILQEHSRNKVSLQVELEADLVRSGSFKALVGAYFQGKRITAKTVKLVNGKGRATLDINDPKLWWPAGMGEQPLYEVRVQLINAHGELLDATARRVGLRTLRMLPPDREKPLRFEANGVSFFAKGGNWIPSDAFATRVTPERLRRYVADAVAVNMNMLRFWGGGYYEEDALYDACDEMGICVWLDFKFGCSAYPAFDQPFLDNVRLEARDNLRRLRHHACIAVWCGNNEISLMTKDEWSDKSMGRVDYDRLFKDLLAEQVKELAPQASYVSGSPDCGDTHYWQVWHGGKTFDAYRTLNGFMSEFGFQSFPEPRTVRSFTAEADRASVTTPVMEWHQRSPNGNEKIRDMTLKYFKPPRDFESALWLSQILQGYAIKLGAEYWRQNMPRSMGCVFWQYNDCWPVASWSSVDYFGRWKALHYMARRFYAPILVSGLEDPAKKTVEVFITSDELRRISGTLLWEITDSSGKSLARGSRELDIAPRESRKVETLSLGEQVEKVGIGNVLTWLKVVVDAKTCSDNLVLLCPPKDLPLEEPKLASIIEKRGDEFIVSLSAGRPALWTWLNLEDADARYSDNFFHLPAKATARIFVRPAKPMTEAEFRSALRVHSLFDIC